MRPIQPQGSVVLNNTAKDFIQFLDDKGAINSEQKQILDRIEKTRIMFGVLSLREKYVKIDDLQDALEERAMSDDPDEKIGQVMLKKGLMTPEQVNIILELQITEKDIPAERIIATGVLPHEVIETNLREFLNGNIKK